MAGLGLSDAVAGFQQGANWKLQNDAANREKGIQDSIDAANAEAGKTIKDAEMADIGEQHRNWMAGGGDDGTFVAKKRPVPDSVMFGVIQDRGAALMRAGQFDEAAKNEVHAQAQRYRVRQGALERFRMDGGPSNMDAVASLAKMIYSTVPDGQEIVGHEVVPGTPASGGYGTSTPATPAKVLLKRSNGDTKLVTAADVMDIAARLSDPNYATHEAAINLMRTKEQLQSERELKLEGLKNKGNIDVEKAKGSNTWNNTALTSAGQMDLANTNNAAHAYRTNQEVAGHIDLANTNNAAHAYRTKQEVAGRQSVATTAAKASVDVADLAKLGHVEGAKITGSAHVESARIGADGATERAKVIDDVKATADLHNLVMKTIGQQMQGALGGNRIGSEETLGIANLAKAAINQAKERGMTLDVGIAVQAAIEQWRKTGARPMPGESAKALEKRLKAADASKPVGGS